MKEISETVEALARGTYRQTDGSTNIYLFMLRGGSKRVNESESQNR
jgi:hypothetical protein